LDPYLQIGQLASFGQTRRAQMLRTSQVESSQVAGCPLGVDPQAAAAQFEILV